MKRTVRFKSVPAYFEVEKSGKKPGTIRLWDATDPRFTLLDEMIDTGELGRIEIENTVTGEVFGRDMTHLAKWDGGALTAIISWHPDDGNTVSQMINMAVVRMAFMAAGGVLGFVMGAML